MNEEAFLQAIREDPDDDAPRLVYADWLEERGDPRAELIRIQLELARTDEHDDNRLDLEVRNDRWFAEHGDRWLSRLPVRAEGQPGAPPYRVQPVDPSVLRAAEGVEWLFRRGLPEVLRADSFAAFRRAGESPRAGTALVAVHLGNLHGTKALARSRLLEGLRELRLHDGHFRDAGLEHLLHSPHLSRLAALALTDDRLTAAGCRALAGWPGLAGLRDLDLHRNWFGDAGARELARSPHLPGLKRLTLWVNDLGPAAAEALAGSDLLAGLRELDLSHNDVGDAGVLALARSGRLGGMERLQLRACRVGRRGMWELARANLPRLRRLDLSQNDPGGEAVEILASAPFLPRLTELSLPRSDSGAALIRALAEVDLSSLRALDLAADSFERDSVAALARWRPFPNVRALRVWGGDGLPGEVLAALGESPALPALTRLDLSDARIGDEGARALAASPLLSRLRALRLWENSIGPAGAKALGASGRLANLRLLRLGFNQIGDEGLAGLLRSPNPPPLTWLDLQCNHIGAEGIRALVDRADRLPLTHLNLSSNRLGDDEAVLLARSRLVARLTRLDLRSNGITDRGAEALLAAAQNNPGLHLILPAGYAVPTGPAGASLEMQARIERELGRRGECLYGVTSW
jgi:uncharacterized protein (TIGR02996 family)